MKKVFVILLIMSGSAGFSQVGRTNPVSVCGTPLPPNYLQWRNSQITVQNLVSTLQHDTCLNKKFSVAFHIVLDSNRQRGISAIDLAGCISRLNSAFARICVSFESCLVDTIPNYSYNDWFQTTTDNLLSPSWDITNTINIYLPDSIFGPPVGYAYMPGGKNVIVIEKGAANSNTSVHEMGHFFGLVHTFAEINPGSPVNPVNPAVSFEYVDRLNCYTHGDGFCDTEADPFPTGYDKFKTPCNFRSGPMDGNSKYYVPPVDNYMTYWTCTCRFSQEQYNFMARVILNTQRLYLH